MSRIKRLYEGNGYVNIPWILSRGYTFNIIIGGRGTGKTYGALKWMIENNKFFIYLRRTQTQADMVGNEFLSPFNKVCKDMGMEYRVDSITKNVNGVWLREDSEPICLTTALSTISNVRGLGASDFKYMVFDEFIKEPREKKLKNEAGAFFHGYETLNRNRELEGEKPIQVLFLSNSEDIVSPLLIELGLVGSILDMKEKGHVLKDVPERDLSLFLLDDSPISQAKSQTAIYKFASGTSFAETSINNAFVNSTFPYIKPQNLKPYKLIIEVGELCIYEHRNNKTLYVSRFKTGSPLVKYESHEVDLKRFKRENRWLMNQFMMGRMWFESVVSQIILTNYME